MKFLKVLAVCITVLGMSTFAMADTLKDVKAKGFIQAGVGFIMLLALSGINRFSLVKSNAIKVFVALVYSISAVAVFAYNDMINWKYGLILSIGNATGGWFMSRWSVKKGDGLVRLFLIIMVIVMAIKLWFFSS